MNIRVPKTCLHLLYSLPVHVSARVFMVRSIVHHPVDEYVKYVKGVFVQCSSNSNLHFSRRACLVYVLWIIWTLSRN